MKFSALSRTGFAVALSAVLASMAAAPAHAELNDSIFAKVSPSIRDRLFFRLNYISANVKMTAEEARDEAGPVMGINDINTYLYNPDTGTARIVSRYYTRQLSGTPAARRDYATQYSQYSGVNDSIARDAAIGYSNEAAGLGAPNGIRSKSQDTIGAPVISAGYFLGDDHSWYVEALVLGAPLKVTVQGDGVNGSGQANGVNGKDIIKLKMLPPIGLLGYYFGERQDFIRPFVGLAASYAIFFDVRATEELNTYQGGGNLGDTTVKLKNSFGVGPFLGMKAQLSDVWHVGFSVGKLRYKTEATLTTRNTTITDSTGVLRDYGPNAVSAIDLGRGGSLRAYTTTSTDQSSPSVSGVTALMCDLAAAKGISSTCNFGTYVRKQNAVMDATMFMLSVGHSF